MRSIGEGAALTVRESYHGPPVLCPWKPFPSDTVSSPMRSAGEDGGTPLTLAAILADAFRREMRRDLRARPADIPAEVQPLRGVDPTKVLRAALKVLLRRFGLRCLSVQERPHEHPDDEVAS